MHQSFVTTPAQRNVEDFDFVSAVPHSKHHTVGAASWQNHDSSPPPQSVIIQHSNVCLGLSNPYISSALCRQRKIKTAHYIPILLRGFGEVMVTNDWCIIYSPFFTSHEHLVLSNPKNILTPNTNMTSADILFISYFRAHSHPIREHSGSVV